MYPIWSPRLTCGDVNTPGFDGFPAKAQAAKANSEATVYNLLQLEPGIREFRLIYHCLTAFYPGPKTSSPKI